MRIPLLHRWFSGPNAPGSALLHVLTPEAAGDRHPLVRLGLAGLAAAGLATASLVALGSLAALMMALAVIYFLATAVLGIRLELDPRVFAEQARAWANQATGA